MDYNVSNSRTLTGVKVREEITGNPNPGYITCSVVYASAVEIIGYWGHYIGWIDLDKEYVVEITFELNGEIHNVNPNFQLCSVDQDGYLHIESQYMEGCDEGKFEDDIRKPYGVISRSEDQYRQMTDPYDERKYYLY
jgi:hypothetical protein